MPYAVAVDIGGTFTDLVAFDHETQEVIYAKSPTTYGNLVDGILECFAKAKIAPPTWFWSTTVRHLSLIPSSSARAPRPRS